VQKRGRSGERRAVSDPLKKRAPSQRGREYRKLGDRGDKERERIVPSGGYSSIPHPRASPLVGLLSYGGGCGQGGPPVFTKDWLGLLGLRPEPSSAGASWGIYRRGATFFRRPKSRGGKSESEVHDKRASGPRGEYVLKKSESRKTGGGGLVEGERVVPGAVPCRRPRVTALNPDSGDGFSHSAKERRGGYATGNEVMNGVTTALIISCVADTTALLNSVEPYY